MINSEENYDPYEKWYSISATESHIKCPRRRWFMKTCKIPVTQSSPTIIGDIGHKCCERFSMADDRGRDNKGLPVNLFPEGWRTMEPRFGKDKALLTITEEEGVLIMTLIQKAIDEGYLLREPGRQVEKEFSHIVYKEGRYKIRLIGFIDLENPNEVLDYKFVKNMDYALSVRPGTKLDIRKSVQMMAYAMTKYIDGHRGNLFLSLLYFIKKYDKPAIKKRSIEITEFDVRQFFNSYILPCMKEMLALDIKYPKSRVLEFLKVPGPDDSNTECNRHYGKPCPFIGVCTERYTVQQYLTTFGMDINDLINSDNQEGVKIMSNPLGNPLIETCKKEIASLGAGTGAPAAGAGIQILSQTGVTITEESLLPAEAPAALTGLEALLGPAALANQTTPVGLEAPPAAAIIAPAAAADPVIEIPPVASGAGLDVLAAIPMPQRAPWFFNYNGQGCEACNANPVQGYTIGMTPCVPCDARSRLSKLHTSDHYNAASLPDGTITHSLKPEHAGGQPAAAVSVQAVAPPVVTETVVMAGTIGGSTDTIGSPTGIVGTTGLPEGMVAPETVVNIPAAAAGTGLDALVGILPDDKTKALEKFMADPNATAKIGPDAGFTSEAELLKGSGVGQFDMMICCAPVKGGVVETVQADNILSQVLSDITTAAGKPVAEIDHFALLQAIDSCIPVHVEELKDRGATVVCFPSTKGSAMDRLVEGLRIHAETVIAPIGI